MDEVGGFEVDGAVRDEHAAKGTRGVTRQRVGIRLGEGGSGRTAARVVVLEDGKRRRVVLEFFHQLHGRVHVQEVVVRKRLAVERLQEAVQIPKVLARLVRVFPVAQRARLRHAHVQRVDVSSRQARTAEVGVDHRVVVRTHAESACREGLAFFERGHAVALQHVHERPVVFHGGHDDHVVEILGRAANECDAADVNLLHDVRFGRAAGDGRFEGVQIDDHEVDVGEVVLGHLGLIAFVIATVQNPPKHLGMQGFYASSQDGRVVGHRFHRHHLGAHRLDRGLGSASRVNRHAQALEFRHHRFEAVLVKHRNESGLDAARIGHVEKRGWV